MPREKTFGTRLKELRLGKHLSQRELADKVAAKLKEQDGRGFDFTYLSKIENERMPPPSQQAILVLALVLDADSDELLALAGKAPSDVSEQLQNEKARVFYRSAVDRNLTPEQWDKLIDKLRRITDE
ncbi:MAG: helix-turn-helix domain-containing protein [Phycisphaerales bacterium]